ncbi:MAG TPA: FAD:protein FMN transferase, partial [Phnomibacter sp.]|nr:FAD:protein FMN transferase [Phnomibacter sp.]
MFIFYPIKSMARVVTGQIFIFLVCMSMLPATAQPHRVQITEAKMGSPFTITVYSADTFYARKQIGQILAYADSLISIFSDYDTSGEVTQLSRYTVGHQVPVSPAMMDLLQISRRAWRSSAGMFDVTMGRVTLLWRNAMQDQQWPDARQVKKARR